MQQVNISALPPADCCRLVLWTHSGPWAIVWRHFPWGFVGQWCVSPGSQQDPQLSSFAGLFRLGGWHFLSRGSSCWTQETCLRVLSCRSEASDTISALMADVHAHKQRHHLQQHTHTCCSLAVIRLTVVVLVVTPLCEQTLCRWLMHAM